MKLKKSFVKLAPFFALLLLQYYKTAAQSSNCTTATPLTLNNGTVCVSGTNVGATATTYTGTGCPSGTINGVWYTYTSNGSNNTFTVTPGTMTNPMILITFSCPNPTLIIETCSSSTGSTPVTTNWGTTTGQQVYIYVASMGGTNGTFNLCVNSQPPSPGAGNTCSQAIPICNMNTFSQSSVPSNSSGQNPTCFGSPPQQDIWYTFTITQSGTLAWQCMPNSLLTEFDWCLWDVSSGCPGTVACCNYHYAGGSSAGFGMQNISQSAACGINSIGGSANKEYCAPIAVTCGSTYAIQISNYSRDNQGFSLNWNGATCTIGSNATFTVSPNLICGTSLTAAITDGSTGDCAAVWTYGDGTTYTGATPPNHTYSAPGTYPITETIGGACPSTHTEFVELLGPLAATLTPTPINCSGQCTGSATLSAVTGGDGIYTYTWSPGGSTSQTVSGLCAGTYSLNIYNAKCNSTITQTVAVTSPPALTITPTFTNASCGSNNGTISASASGGTPTYSFNINGGAYSGSGNFGSLAAGTYTIGVKDSKGCTITASVTISNSPVPVITVNSATMCPGASTTLTASGASTYTWNPGTGLSATTGASVTCTATASTVYTVTGTSVGGCTATATSSITIGGTISPTANSATICAGNSASLTASGGTTYTWSPGTGLSSTSGSTVTANPSASTTYTITAASGGCTGTVTAHVTVNPNPTVTANSATICIGQQTATLTASGASTYSWSPATGLSSTSGTSVTANPSSSTAYTITGTSASGCVNTWTTNVAVNPLPSVTATNGLYCTGGSATLTASGASTYSWSPGTGLSSTTGSNVTANPPSSTNYTVTGTDANGCVNTTTTSVTVVTTPTLVVPSATTCVNTSTPLNASGASTYSWSPGTGLSATTGSTVTANPTSTTVYTITGTAGTCSAVTTATVTVNPLPTVTANSATICIGQQTATLIASGASTYSWSPATGLSSTSGTSVTANPSSSMTYTITGTSASGCVNTGTTSVTVNPLPTVTVNHALICAGSTATLTASGATTYSWMPGTGLSSTTGPTVTGNPSSTTHYTVVGMDANGCLNGDTTTITVVTNPSITVNSANICKGQQTATLTANGASTYTWSPATGLSSTGGSSVTANSSATTIYTVTGSVGTCTAVNTSTVTVNPIPPVTVNSASICVGQQTATLTAGGAANYSWTPSGSLSSGTGGSVTAHPASTIVYTVTGTDANGCYNSATSTVTVNPLPLVTASSATICPNTSATITAGGANSYTWNTGTTTPSLTVTPASTTSYTVVGMDNNGCFAPATATVTVNPGLAVIASSNSPLCAGATINLSANAGVSWSWTGPVGFNSTQQNPSRPNAASAMSGTYTVSAVDANGCTGTATINVVVNPLPTPVAGSNSPVCVNGTLNLTSSSGSLYAWSGPNSYTSTTQNPTIPNVTPANGGSYSVTVIDVNGCINTATVNVVINPLPVIVAGGTTVCVNNSIHLSVNNSGVNYQWNGPNSYTSTTQNPTITNATTNMSGTYTVTVTDASSCSNTDTVHVVVNPLPTVTASSARICKGASTTLNANGASSYTWAPISGLSSATGASVSASPSSTTVYTVTGSNANGCKSSISPTVTVNQPPVVHINPAVTSGCKPVCVTFTNTSSAGAYNWNFGDGNALSNSVAPTHCYNTPGTYTAHLAVVDSNGCKDSSYSIVTVYPIPQANFYATPQPTTILDPEIHFYDISTGAGITTWHWSFGDPGNHTASVPNPSFIYGDAGSYSVHETVTSNYGCKDSITIIIKIDEDFTLYVPNAFSPNFDGVNDVFYAKGEGVHNFQMWIFDRWGEQVFYSDDIYKGWDGTLQGKGNDIVQQDVYVWKIEAKSSKGELHSLRGQVSLLK